MVDQIKVVMADNMVDKIKVDMEVRINMVDQIKVDMDKIIIIKVLVIIQEVFMQIINKKYNSILNNKVNSYYINNK